MPPRRQRASRPASVNAFAAVQKAALWLPGVEAGTKYDGSPVLRLGGCFVAGMATHRSAESGTLVVRVDLEERAQLLEEAPDIYYVTSYYQRHPVVLVRLSRIGADALRDLLAVSRRLTLPKVRTRSRRRDEQTQLPYRSR
jgi:hypothetical protein